jgi:hypothetical protein
MKTLQESLFDKNIVKNSDVKLGELYEISPVRHANGVTNDIRKVLGMFDEKAWARAKFPLRVREDCGFIEYWSDMEPKRLVPFINMIFNLSMVDINKLFENPSEGSKHVAKCLEKYYSYHGGKAKNIYITGRHFGGDSLIEITVCDNIMLPSPSSIKLTFEKRPQAIKTTESLFDQNLVEKDILENREFKKWINRPDVLWWLYDYWADEMEDNFEDFMPNEWAKYKDIVDWVLDKINQKSGNMWPMYRIMFDAVEYFDEIKDAFGSEDEYNDQFQAASYEIEHKSMEEYDGVYKTWFKGSMPRNSAVTEFMSNLPDEGRWSTKPGALAGGIFLTTSDGIMVWSLPRGIDKNILKLFNIIR